MAEIIKGLDLAVYHDPANGWVSHSRLHDFIERGPAYYRGRYITGEIARKETAALTFGQALEDLFQRGGEYFAQHYAVRPAHLKGNTTAGKQWAAAQQDRKIVTDEDWQSMLAMVASLRTCEKGVALVDGAEEQITLRGEVFGLRMQARPDYVHLSEYGAYSVDLKTTRDMNEVMRGRAPVQFGYITQAALVRRLMQANGYTPASAYLFVVESQASYRRECFEVEPEYLAWADQLLEKECAELKRCLDSDVWPLGSDEVITLKKPGWARVEQEVAQ